MRDHITVCVCTYHRNRLLEKLLRTLSQQLTGGLFDVSVVVVDNDAQGPAEETVSNTKKRLGLDIIYGIEAEHSISAARNHTLRLAKGNHIAFIDDDEFAPIDWLLTMYHAIQTFDVDGALGPVIPFFEQHPSQWLIKSGLCERPVIRTGTLLHWNDTRTGNALLRRDVFDRNNLCFELKYRTSGSDKEFFREAMYRGCRFIAVQEAPVYEVVPPERQTKGYFIRRSILQASNERKYRAPMLRGVSKILVPVKTALALTVYSLLLPVRALFGSHYMVRDVSKIAYHLSWLLTMVGFDLAKKRDL
jgi:succinoglycan biosynthesis protein ExoM